MNSVATTGLFLIDISRIRNVQWISVSFLVERPHNASSCDRDGHTQPEKNALGDSDHRTGVK
jgi:hypothetical protein